METNDKNTIAMINQENRDHCDKIAGLMAQRERMTGELIRALEEICRLGELLKKQQGGEECL
jgi:hypothetical protein